MNSDKQMEIIKLQDMAHQYSELGRIYRRLAVLSSSEKLSEKDVQEYEYLTELIIVINEKIKKNTV